MNNLFKFESTTDCNVPTGSPQIMPVGGRGLFASLSRNFLKSDSLGDATAGLINVVNDFHWTSSHLRSRQDVPYINLKEKRLKTNALIAQLAYYSLIAAGKGGEVGGRLGKLIGSSKTISGTLGNLFNSSLGQKLTGLGKSLLGGVSNFGSGVLNSGITDLITGKNASGFINSITWDKASSSVLTPYEGLYITEDTKFTYVMPYFEDVPNAVKNAFSTDDHIFTKKGGLGSMIGKLAGDAEGLSYGLSTSMNIMEPGIYIEKPQFYQNAASGDSLKFSFPLINTGWSTIEDVQINWQLIYMLIYQNRPNRKSRDLIDPPCLYEVMIPGVKFMPYAYISGLSVQFMGSRRSYYLNVPSLKGTSKILTIVPDAYMVNITLQGLVAESQNFLYHMLFEQDIVNVTESSSSGGNLIESILEGFRREVSNNSTQ